MGGITLPLLVLFWPTALGGNNSFVFVQGVSMQPALYEGDLAVVRKQSSYEPSDVVAFRVPEGDIGEGAIVIHRVIGGDGESGYVLQGDNRSSPDRWHPKNDDVIGRMWLDAPNLGGWMRELYDPLGRGALVGMMAVFLMIGHNVSDNAPRRRLRPGIPPRARKAVSAAADNPDALWIISGTLALLGALLAILAVYSFTRSATDAEFVERTIYENNVSYEYSVQTNPSTLYEGDVIGPITPDTEPIVAPVDPLAGESDGPTVESSVPPIFADLAQRLLLSFNYTANAPGEISEAGGEIEATLVIGAGEGNWRRDEVLLEPIPFTGASVSHDFEVDIAGALATVQSIEDETGFVAAVYDISVVPEVRFSGMVGDTAVDDVHTSEFKMQVSSGRIIMDPQLSRTAPQTLGQIERSSADISAAGVSMPVSTVRWLATLLALTSLALAGGVAFIAYYGIGGGETARIRARYGSMIVAVADGGRNYSMRRIKVASMKDLARVAKRDGGIILHEKNPRGGSLYFVDDGAVSYEYEVDESALPRAPTLSDGD